MKARYFEYELITLEICGSEFEFEVSGDFGPAGITPETLYAVNRGKPNVDVSDLLDVLALERIVIDHLEASFEDANKRLIEP